MPHQAGGEPRAGAPAARRASRPLRSICGLQTNEQPRTQANTLPRDSAFSGIFARFRWPSRFSSQSGRTVQIGFVMRFSGVCGRFAALNHGRHSSVSFSAVWTVGCGPLRSRYGCQGRAVWPRSSGTHASRRDRWIAVGHRRSLRLGAGDRRAFAEQAERLVVWSCGARVENPAVAVTV